MYAFAQRSDVDFTAVRIHTTVREVRDTLRLSYRTDGYDRGSVSGSSNWPCRSVAPIAMIAGNEDRIYSEKGDCVDLLNEEFDYEKASARILGRDVGQLLTDISRAIVKRALSHETDQYGVDALATAMIRNTAGGYGDYDVAITMLAELEIGTSESDRL